MSKEEGELLSDSASGRLLVIGGGTMGQQIALQAAMQGVDVALTDVSDEALASARSRIRLVAR